MATIRKRTLPSGAHAWLAEYRDGEGKRRFKQFKTRKLADDFLLTARGEVRAGVHVAESESVTVGKAGELWLATADARGLERSTADQYRQHVEIHIKPFLGATKLSKLNVAAVRSFEDKLRSEGRSPAMVRKVLVSLGSLLADAQERGHVARNVVREKSKTRQRGVDRRVEKRQKGKLRVGVDIPTPAEIRAIVGALEGRWRPLFLTAIFAGLRASELRGLTWRDVDLKKGIIHVRQRADRFNEIGQPKSEAGERSVPIPPVVTEALTGWKKVCPKGDLNLCFPTGAGSIEGLANMRRRGWMPVQIKAGVSTDTGEEDDDGNPIMDAKYSGLHSARHFFASWLINRKEDGGLGLPLKVVQDRMGHATVSITADTYGHLFPVDTFADELAAAQAVLLGSAT
ncbi:tyrosine-type recombinase/integrase [Ensifer adhaerens]|uniref:tyrosine-type recombinase/integrase n=1 Tax=Ensifer adhaerens TaxID=106592 RepID=UPI00098FB73B|nr:site-specific integrase [Ensifer adhaerens]